MDHHRLRLVQAILFQFQLGYHLLSKYPFEKKNSLCNKQNKDHTKKNLLSLILHQPTKFLDYLLCQQLRPQLEHQQMNFAMG